MPVSSTGRTLGQFVTVMNTQPKIVACFDMKCLELLAMDVINTVPSAVFCFDMEYLELLAMDDAAAKIPQFKNKPIDSKPVYNENGFSHIEVKVICDPVVESEKRKQSNAHLN